jgi:hypothetical protein
MVGQTQLTLGGPVVLAKTAALVGAMNALLAVFVTPIVARAANRAAGSIPGHQVRADRAALGR